MSKLPEEATKEAAARKAVTEGLTNPDIIRLLSAAGDAAKKSRTTSPLPRSHTQEQKQKQSVDYSCNDPEVNETSKKEQKPSG